MPKNAESNSTPSENTPSTGDVTAEKPRGARRNRVRNAKADSLRPSKAPYNFPKNSLEECVRLAQAIEEKNAGKPIPAKELPTLVGFHQPSDWRFLDLLRSSEQFGLTTGTGQAATIALGPIGLDVVSPSDVEQRRKALVSAFNQVGLFEKVTQFYSGKRLPEDEFFGNTLVREFDIPRDRVERFIAVYTASLRFVNSFLPVQERINLQDHRESSDAAPDSQVVEMKPQSASTISMAKGSGRSRTFLDSCFVLMPFGGWFDRYYKEVYSPAIQEAGFDPVRADDLFQSGSVMEQIWAEIHRAKVLVAEVTGRNANVFYELGLSHAAGRPVVILTASLDDVPFDLRHLRIVVYDVRDPIWASKLQAALSSHLRNAKQDPSKSLPQTFRAAVAADSRPISAGVSEQGSEVV